MIDPEAIVDLSQIGMAIAVGIIRIEGRSGGSWPTAVQIDGVFQ